MTKPYEDNEVSTQVCRNCGKPMKLNLLHRNSHAKYCYVCWMVTIRKKFQKNKWLFDAETKKRYAKTIYLLDVIKANRKRYKKKQ